MFGAAPSRHLPVLVTLAACSLLSGCMTPHVQPKASEAIVEARSHRDNEDAAACPQTKLSEASPVLAGFPFDESNLADWLKQELAEPVHWLSCHPTVAVVIKPDADGHGTAAEQDAIARSRGAAVRDYLAAQGIAAARIRVLERSQAEPAGEHFLIRAEGRRW